VDLNLHVFLVSVLDGSKRPANGQEAGQVAEPICR
jgi:hypothetical protein